MVKETIPIHADLLMSASVIPAGQTFNLKVGQNAVSKKSNRNVYVHLTTANGGKSKLKVNNNVTLAEGDAAMITKVNDGDELSFESVGSAEAEVVVLDSD